MKFKFLLFVLVFIINFSVNSQTNWDELIDEHLKEIIKEHKDFVSIPNLPENKNRMLKNINWVADNYKTLGFKVSLLESSSLPLLLFEKEYNPEFSTVLFYFHIDGQPVDANNWDQKDPFIPVLKSRDEKGNWKTLNWDAINQRIDNEWRIFARAAADDKGPIVMLLNALKFLNTWNCNTMWALY